MAKPGREARAAMAGARDLSRAKMTEEQARGLQEDAERMAGVRCQGCGRRIREGFRFTSLDPRAESPLMQFTACAREECDFAEMCRAGATWVEPVGPFAWVDENGLDAPPTLRVLRRQGEQAEAASKAAEANGHDG